MYIAASVASAAVAAGVVKVFRTRQQRAELERARRLHAHQLTIAQSSWKTETEQTLQRAEQKKNRLERQLREREQQLASDEEVIARKVAALDARESGVKERDEALAERFAALKARQADISEIRDEISRLEELFMTELERSAGQPRTHAVEALTQNLIGDAQLSAQKASVALEERVADQCHAEARRLMELSMYRYGSALSANRLVATIDLPEKKKLREAFLADDAAVLRAIHDASEVEFIDQGDGAYFLQAPDPFTREIGRLAFERMARAGHVSESIAHTAVEKARKDLDKIARDAGKRAARILKLEKIHPEILYLVGKLLYRTSYTQNQWQHAIETAHLCGMMASEMGLDIRTAHRAALLHDIGKVLWAETEAVGSHAVSGATFAAAHGEIPEIVHPIAAHHADEKPSTPLAHLVAAADALSGARPGARRETLEAYTQRVDDIEAICASLCNRGVQRYYVIQGGREVRVEVDPRRVDDEGAARLSADVARTIEEGLVYPGQIKVTVLRETSAHSMARA
ncbi:MAG: HD domain-containing protein [Myxococcota bacterium]|nr:HD domain-containing protein [Myxococcota bacterium]